MFTWYILSDGKFVPNTDQDKDIDLICGQIHTLCQVMHGIFCLMEPSYQQDTVISSVDRIIVSCDIPVAHGS